MTDFKEPLPPGPEASDKMRNGRREYEGRPSNVPSKGVQVVYSQGELFSLVYNNNDILIKFSSLSKMKIPQLRSPTISNT